MDVLFTILCIGIMLCYVIFTLSIFGKAKGIYDEYIEPVSEEEHKLKKFLPIGLYIDDNIDLTDKLPSAVSQALGRMKMSAKSMIIELNDAKYADYYYSIFSAEKKVISIFAMVGTSALGCILCFQGDSPTGMGFTIIGTIFGIVLSFLMDNSLKGKIDKRRAMLRLEFPDFVNKLVLLINAGMTVTRAWEKIVTENKNDSPLQQELRIAYLSMKDGTPEAYAIEAFGRRCKIKEIMKFTSVLISNLKKGGAEMVPVLVQQSNECWEMRKGAAKELGATAGVKMMLPMVMLLASILLVVGCPAIFAFSGA